MSNLEIKTFETRDEQEIAGYAQVMDLIFASWREIDATKNHIRRLHRDLLRHSAKDERHRGAWKTSANSIAAFDEAGQQIGIVFETASPFDTPARMKADRRKPEHPEAAFQGAGRRRSSDLERGRTGRARTVGKRPLPSRAGPGQKRSGVHWRLHQENKTSHLIV
ncbi:hypothetical protein [Tabrizicola sp.]|uniref:hypothetical protein n=1 Tax=Tabrizicola sp. TaxID=2005166 RepID=UPI0035AD853C